MFDIILLTIILLSVAAVSVESVPELQARYGATLRALEWLFTALFSIEYVLRLISARNPVRYAFSFFGIVDLVAVLPSYCSLFLPGSQSFLVIRVLRLLRIFRILKLGAYLAEARVLKEALQASRPKITVFLTAVLSVVVVVGAVMYLIEGNASGFTSIPRSMYWAIVTMTTVGYGDITPRTPFGQTVAAILMILGYGIIAVPTGIVSVELANATRHQYGTRTCPTCQLARHDGDARHCKRCGTALPALAGNAQAAP
jgi:Kef-type K+ transport systems, predicted NAD-binding component